MGYPAGMLGDFPFPLMGSMGGLSAASLASAGLMANFPKLPLNVPFGALPNLSMTNPMLGLGGFGLPGIPVSSAAAAAVASMSEAADDKKQKESKSTEKERKSPKSSSSNPTPHPSFPIMYNPLLYNPLFAAQGLRNFTLPPNLPTSFASLAQAGFSNGMADMEAEEEGEVKYYKDDAQNEAQDLSVRHSKDKKTVREKLEELRARQRGKEQHSGRSERKRSRVSDIVQDLTMKKRAASPEKPQDLTVKQKEIKPNRIIDKCNKSKVEGKLERLVAKLKAVDKSRPSSSTTAAAVTASGSQASDSVPAPPKDDASTSLSQTDSSPEKKLSKADKQGADPSSDNNKPESEETASCSDKGENCDKSDSDLAKTVGESEEKKDTNTSEPEDKSSAE